MDNTKKEIRKPHNSRASKKLSYLLRHSQDPLYISLEGGWAKVEAILDTLQISQTQLEQIVAEDEKGNVSEGALHTCSRATAFDKARYIMSVRNLNGIEIDEKDLD